MEFRVVIPARFASTRLPGKVLRKLAGKPMLEHVWLVAQASGANQVIVATDDERVSEAVLRFGGEVCMTGSNHRSGTDRLNEVAQQRNWGPDEIVVNLQGDEPLMPPQLVAQAARELSGHREADISTIAGELKDLEEWRNPNVVKVLCDANGYALYFSRAPIPWDRAGFAAGTPELPRQQTWRHIGLYAYRVDALRRFSVLPPAGIERSEELEQLRALYHGMRIRVGIASEGPGPGVDTEEDLRHAEGLLARR